MRCSLISIQLFFNLFTGENYEQGNRTESSANGAYRIDDVCFDVVDISADTQRIEIFATLSTADGNDPLTQTNDMGRAWFEVHYWVGHSSAIPGLR